MDTTRGPFCETFSRDEMIDKCKNDKYECAGLLIHDGFEFKDDYPFRL